MRLSAPIIEGTLPAFYASENGVAEIAVPFSMSRAVSKDQIKGLELKIRSVYGSTLIDTYTSSRIDETNNIAYFIIDNINTNNKYFVGNFYKAQIAYIEKATGEIGFYSTVGVIKYTSKPEIKINNLTVASNNTHLTSYTGVYNQYQKDISEKVYQYRFIIKNENEVTIEDTGWLLHNRNNDDSQYESHDVFYFNKALEDNKKYKIQYVVKTNNGLEVKTPFYNIVVRKSVNPNFIVDIDLTANNENGYVNILLKRNSEGKKNNEVVKGSFLLSRSSEKSNFTEWEEVARFNLTSHRSSLKTIKDFAIEQGIKYKYSIQQFNDQNLYSTRNISDEIMVDYEHSFLYDGERQLKIKYNPKISSFKTDVLEAKVDTIGSKYPFIFRNGNVAYKEFPIGGLISYLSDEEKLFLDNSNSFEIVNREKTTARQPWEKKWVDPKVPTNSLRDYNFQLERDFKLEVLEWLNNGKPKLFKSPTEGIYLVRIMNVSMSPEETVGRLIHNFTATAYEIGEPTYKGLDEHGLIDLSFTKDMYYKFSTIPLATTDYNYYYTHQDIYEEIGEVYYAKGNILPNTSIKYLKVEDVLPGSVLYINNEPIMIGVTGTYESPIEVSDLFIPEGSKLTGQITIGYFAEAINSFDEINKMESRDILGHQFFGYHENILNELNNAERQVNSFYDIKAYRRNIKEAYYYTCYRQLKWAEINQNRPYDYYYKENDKYIPAENTSQLIGKGIYQREEYIFLKNLNDKDGIITTAEVKNNQEHILYKYIIYPLKYNPEYLQDNAKVILDYVKDNIDLTVAYRVDSHKKYQKEIIFEDINNNLKSNIEEINYKNRTSTIYPFLSDNDTKNLWIKYGHKDFGNLSNNSLSFPIYYYILPEIKTNNILANEVQYFVDEECVNINGQYQSYETKLYINEDEYGIDIEKSQYFSSGPAEKINKLKSSAGIYLELYYQAQVVEYNAETLMSFDAKRYNKTKVVLDEYNYKLSREYTNKKIAENDLKSYAAELNTIYQNYDNVYQEYIKFLEDFIKALEEE